MKISFFKFFSPFVFLCKTLKHNVWIFWLLEGDKLHFFSLSKQDSFGQESFANLAFEFAEVIRNRYSTDLPLDFTGNPIFETSCMNQLTRAFTCAWVYQWISGRCLIAQADFTGT